jgi:hypothetical protein
LLALSTFTPYDPNEKVGFADENELDVNKPAGAYDGVLVSFFDDPNEKGVAAGIDWALNGNYYL